MLPEVDGVDGGEGGLLAGPHVPRLEALPRLSLNKTTTINLVLQITGEGSDRPIDKITSLRDNFLIF